MLFKDLKHERIKKQLPGGGVKLHWQILLVNGGVESDV